MRVSSFRCLPITTTLIVEEIAFILRKFIQHRKEMDEFLVSGTTMNRERYHRLIALSCVDTVVTLPLGAYIVWVNAVHGPPMQPWIGWAAVHSNFSAAWPFPADVWKSVHWFRVAVYWREWVYVVCTVFYVAFFGFTEEMRRWYIKPFVVVRSVLGLRPSAPAKHNTMSITFQTVQTSQSTRFVFNLFFSSLVYMLTCQHLHLAVMCCAWQRKKVSTRMSRFMESVVCSKNRRLHF